jgi:hypothetical protein
MYASGEDPRDKDAVRLVHGSDENDNATTAQIEMAERISHPSIVALARSHLLK